MIATRCLLAATSLLVGCGSKEQLSTVVASSASQATIHAEVVEIKHTPMPISVEATGQVAAIFHAGLSSRIQGTIDTLFVREGMAVAKGQTLIQLDNRDARADLARISAELENTKAQLDRMNQLYAQDAVSKQEMENATRAFKIAEANRKAVLAQLSYTVVKAPFDGVITEKMVEAGELASPGQLLLRMENQRRLRLHATVAERDVNSVSLGDKVSVVIDALNDQALDGVVGQILPAGDLQTHTFTVKVDLPAEPGLKTGMFGRFQLNKGTSETILVPGTAVVERGELTSVFVIGSDQLTRLRWVKVGRRFDHQVEILSGVNDRELVLLDAARGIEGAAVTIAHTAEPPAVPTPCSMSCQSSKPRVARSVFRVSGNSL